MFKARSLQSLITEKITLGKISNTGYHTIKCECCHDYKMRGGFKFEDGLVYYACFNCGLKPIYTENSGVMSKTFRKVLKDFGITDPEIDGIINLAFYNKKKDEDPVITLESLKKPKIVEVEVKLPRGSIRLGSTDDNPTIQTSIRDYLKSRHIDPHSYPFYYSLHPKFLNRVIIPFYKNKNLIYWQARSIIGEEPRYRNCEVPKTNIMFNIDQLTSWSAQLPLFVCEGVFDALPIEAIGTLGSALNDEKIELLNRTKRRLIFIIDKDVNGRHMGEIALKNGWDITFSPGKDVNDSIMKYGMIWTVYELMRNIPKSNLDANLQLKLNCSYDPRKDKNKK